ncbi:MAG: NAD(P)-dependent oxidoreductase [Lachnospiraceae bacterium]|nr:NAD(P)-dependent oxidoreductase [Lachnospiraceae bacterium]
MNILIAGGAGTFLNNILIKLHKEGHKVSVLTGNRFADKDAYQKNFEVYKFQYDASCLNEIFESVSPDVTIFMGAFDTNFEWKNEEADSVKYTASLANILMGYAMRGKGRFIYLSSHEVFGDNHDADITENLMTSPDGFRAQSIYQGEQMCENYRSNRDMDIVTVRFDHLYCIPEKRADIKDVVTSMCLEALEEKTIHYAKSTFLSPLYENDGVEALYRIISCERHNADVYHVSASNQISEEELANLVRDNMNPECDVISTPGTSAYRCVLSNRLYESEFGNPRFMDLATIVKRIATNMKKKAYVFLTDEETGLSFTQRLKKKLGWFISTMIPFLENVIIFIPCFMFYNRAAESSYFARLDIYLLYVLLFAIVYGQQQATLSALLAVAGYFFRNTYEQTGFRLLLDSNTYVWVAQLFIVGLSVGYLRDQIIKLRKENEEEKEFLKQQIEDIQVINSTNVRVKDVLETQVVNQTDSVGKIYGITSSLDQYSPEEVLFYAARTVSELMKTEDVAIYQVSNADYARLFSSTSAKSRVLGNSVRYTEMGDCYEALRNRRVYINRKMDGRYPLMANAIFENDQMQMIVMLWGLSWENMTLGEANKLVIISALIQNAVLRANRYILALEDQRYEEGTKMLEKDSFRTLLDAFLKAEKEDLTECSVIRVKTDQSNRADVIGIIEKSLRTSDYLGNLGGSEVYALLSNTTEEGATFVLNRFLEKGLEAAIVEEGTI